MNRYITVLLVVLAATGEEAQKYESALKLAMADMSFQEALLQPEAKALEQDILSVIKAIKEASEEEHIKQTNFSNACIFTDITSPRLVSVSAKIEIPSYAKCEKGYFYTIFIRGPTA